MTRTLESGQRFCGGVSVEKGLPLREGTPITINDRAKKNCRLSFS